jgi:hypothetical protein
VRLLDVRDGGLAINPVIDHVGAQIILAELPGQYDALGRRQPAVRRRRGSVPRRRPSRSARSWHSPRREVGTDDGPRPELGVVQPARLPQVRKHAAGDRCDAVAGEHKEYDQARPSRFTVSVSMARSGL